MFLVFIFGEASVINDYNVLWLAGACSLKSHQAGRIKQQVTAPNHRAGS